MDSKLNPGIETLVQIARLYYYEDKTQSEIAAIMKVSRPQISKLLMKAKEMNIVTVSVQSPANNTQRLQDILTGQFKLQSVCVVPERQTGYEAEELLAEDAANYIDRFVARASNVGLGWGSLMYKICGKAVQQTLASNSDLAPLCGSVTATNHGYNTNELVRQYSTRFLIRPHFLYAPAFPLTQQERDAFCSTENFNDCSALWDAMDVAVFRISNHPCSPDLATGYRYGDRLDTYRAVGNFLTYYYDINGSVIPPENDFAICATLDQLRATPIRLAVASSFTSAESLLGALRSGCVTHLIAAEHTLRDLVRLLDL